MKSSLLQLSLFFLFFAIGGTFQNCSNQNFLHPNKSPTHNLPANHPAIEGFNATSSSTIALLDRKGIESVFRDVFINEGVTENEQTAFDNIFAAEILTQQHMFGRPCDAVATGTMLDCNYNLANLSQGMDQSSSTVREASRIQLCRRLVSRKGLLIPLLSRLGVLNQSPSESSIQSAIELFYPRWDNPAEARLALMKLDAQMANRNESIQNRWSLIISTICESPFWEVL
jgi:hypothetical protein